MLYDFLYIKTSYFLFCFIKACLIFLLWFPAQAQKQSILTEFTTENGLSINSVNDLLFDKQGFLWVATADGLQRFDGYRFQTFRHKESDKRSLPVNYTGKLYADMDDNLWITHADGLTFKPKGKFEFIDLTSLLPPPTNKTTVSCVGETDSEVWMISYPSGIYAINKTSLTIKKLFPIPPEFGDDGMEIIYPVLAKGEVAWMRKKNNTTGDLFSVTSSGVVPFKNEKNTNLFFIIPEKDSLVVFTNSVVYKAAAENPFMPVRLLSNDFKIEVGANGTINYPKKLGSHEWLLPGSKSSFVFDAVTNLITPFPYAEYFGGSNRYLNVTARDGHGNIWFGYNGVGGIKLLTPSSQKFNLFQRPDNNALVYCLFASDKVYAGIYLGDIEVYNERGQFLKKIILPEEYKTYASPRAMALIDSQTLIVKSTFNELYAINTKTNRLQSLSHLLPAQKNSIPVADFEPAIQKVSEGVLFLSYRNSLLSINKKELGFTVTRVCNLPVQDRISAFYKAPNGELWLGTTNSVWCFYENQFRKLSLPHLYVKQITRHPDGKLWIASTDGIYVLADGKLVKHLTTEDGLANAFVYGILFDEAGVAWVSTNRGLSKIDTGWKITSYSSKEGLQGEEFNTRGYSKGAYGNLYFAGVNGINFFSPKNFIYKGEASPTTVTAIEVNNIGYLPSIQTETIQTITLPYDQNNIRLSFSCMDFTVPKKNQYKFWLKGFQKDWTAPQTNNSVQYILPPGEYELLVNGANYEGVWSDKPLHLYINILPPWYQTNMARTLFLLLIVSAFASLIYFILRKKYKKKLRLLEITQQVQKEKERISRDLHDNLGSQITWISNNITQLERAEKEKTALGDKINHLKDGTQELMQTLRETIWILHKDKIGCVDLFDKVVSFAARQIESCPPLQLHTEEKIADDFTLSSSQALQLFRICQEAITNSCKHAQASSLTITAVSSNHDFSFSIIDNGKGLDITNTSLEGHYGLQNMKERAAESGLDLQISSAPGKGTMVVLVAVIHS